MTTVDVAPKNFLTSSEMTKFLAAARLGKHGVRDYLLGLMAYRHGMRVSELIHIRLDDIDLDAGRIFVRRAKGSMSTSHPMQGDEVRAVRAWLRERKHFLPNKLSRRGCRDGEAFRGEQQQPPASALGIQLDTARNGDTPLEPSESQHSCEKREADSSPFLFLNEKRRVFARQAINYLFCEIGKRAGIGHVHPHMCRHAAGYALANAGVPTRTIQLFLGHKDIHHTERYTTLSAKALDNIVWQV